jgi:hypothetical protein
MYLFHSFKNNKNNNWGSKRRKQRNKNNTDCIINEWYFEDVQNNEALLLPSQVHVLKQTSQNVL